MLIVGDVHGDSVLVDKVLALREPTVFVGDFFDSFRYSRAEQVKALVRVLRSVEEDGNTLIAGNHEWSYINPQKFRCSGFNTEFWIQVQPLIDRILKVAVPFVWDEKHSLLITHAGLSNQIFQEYIEAPVSDIPIALTEWFRDKERDSPYFQVGRARGGSAKVGGPLWCDWQREFSEIPGVKQVFGHSASDMPASWLSEVHEGSLRRIHDSWNIDCLQRSHTIAHFDETTGTISAREV